MRYFVAAGHTMGGGARGQGLEEGAVAIAVARELVRELHKRRAGSAIHVPDELDLSPTIAWINSRAKPGDRALELHLNAAGNTTARGSLVAVTTTSRPWAGPLVGALAKATIPKWGKGVYDETEIAAMRGWTHLGFPHQTRPSAALLELGFITNPSDASLFKTAAGIRAVAAALAATLEPAAAKSHRPPWALYVAGKRVATGRLTTARFRERVARALRRKGKVELRDADEEQP